jgi:hypothetical protein
MVGGATRRNLVVLLVYLFGVLLGVSIVIAVL